ncbi:MAG: stage 0 sporulation family protein [Clostridia bacterium]|nr:stage 0 sporulation family protein [Clostridia bacterium]
MTIIGVRFREAGKIYYFDPAGVACSAGDDVIVKTARGSEIGRVVIPNKLVKTSQIVLPLRSLERKATKQDIERHERNLELEKEAYKICLQKIKDHGLDMKLIDARYTFDNSKLLFNFTAEKRVDFRELVKDLAFVFRTRIELRQIGIRDEAKLMGGLGVCGRPFCCATFLSDFAQVSIKMAKEQNLSLNSSKISGTCGRLMCCLRFENDVYEEEIRRMPPCDSKVKTPDGVGVVTEISPLTHLVKVKFVDKNETVSIKAFDASDVKVLERQEKPEKKEKEEKEKE